MREHSRTAGSVRFLLYLLADYTSERDKCAYPSLATLMRDLNLDRRTVQRAIRAAEATGELRVEVGRHEAGRSEGTFSRYHVLCGLADAHEVGGAGAAHLGGVGAADLGGMGARSRRRGRRQVGGAGAARYKLKEAEKKLLGGSSLRTNGAVPDASVLEEHRRLLHDESVYAPARLAALKYLERYRAATDEDRAQLRPSAGEAPD